jgi:protein involved in polysaccharide export with SLBB domain
MNKLVRWISIVLFVFLCSQYNPSHAQDLSAVRVDQLSDSQVRELMRRAESIGYNDAQLEQMAASQGMPSAEVQKLRSRVATIRNRDGRNAENQTGNNTGSSTSQPSRQYNPDNLPDTSLTSTEDLRLQQMQRSFEELKPKIFGAELFRNANISFQPNMNMPTPQGYIIGPGDELLIDITGDNEASYNLAVSPEGFINIEFVGRVAVGGLSIEAATSKLRSAMSTTYPALRTGRSSVAINLGNIRSIQVTILGEVAKPGSYTLPSLATVFNALYASGGPNPNGSFRAIEVIRNNRVIETIDVYDFLLRGMQANNIRLQDQDIIRVPVFQTRVQVSGEIKRPALYETVEGESLQDVLDFAGGFTTQAYTANVKILQNTARERRVTDVTSGEFANYEPRNGDQYVVEAILDRFENRITINGAVFRPGVFELEPGLTLSGLISKADGLREDAFLSRGYIQRLQADNTQELISFDVASIMNGSTQDIPLQREDIVQISSIFDLRDEFTISVGGEVRQPGTFDYAENMTVASVIQMAGGFSEGASPNRVEIARRARNVDVSNPSASAAEVFTIDVNRDLSLEDADFILQPYDIVSIRSESGFTEQMQVTLQGEVVYPGTYTVLHKNERISDVIKRAGGLTAFAYEEGASLRRPKVAKDTSYGRNANTERAKYLNLQRMSAGSDLDSIAVEDMEEVLTSDLVGIDLKNINRKPYSREDLILEDGDIITVPKLLQTVSVNGEVLKPNNIVYEPGMRFKSYVNGAGGFTHDARKSGAYIQYANGSVAATRKVLFFNNYPSVKPGAEIFIPKRAPRERLNAQGWVGLSSAVVGMAALLFSVLK